ncbi:hypothetical protein GF325_10365 [Candidatus Bathyarchaeota archaeon]|nr:hypothetical protein [Candidatus Bathyarchaeota archaeon]
MTQNTEPAFDFTITRLQRNPIISPRIFGWRVFRGKNINGPSLVKVPDWVEEPLGKYYLYFGHHQGQYIRLAHAEQPEGPYTLYKPGVLHNKDTFIGSKHLASPEIYIDEENKQVRMYFHAAIRGTGAFYDQGQTSYLAMSTDGIHFIPREEIMGPFYMRVFTHDGWFFSIGKNDNVDAMLLRSKDGLHQFERGPTFEPHFRHCALLKRGNILHVFYTKAFEKPESILHATMNLEGDWTTWTLGGGRVVLRPERDWEGATLPLKESRYGGTGKANALRDPCIFEDGNGEQVYLLYSVKGEKGIAIATIDGL